MLEIEIKEIKMKKFLAVSFTLVLVMMCFTLSVFAADAITESPGVKVVIDGQIGAYPDTPITVNGRTLLPLRAILTNLGVQNDDQHIIWNGSESSVTVIKDSQKIYLKIGSGKAYVNGAEVLLDAAPVIYRNKTYIPARFVAQSLGKKVVWDPATTSVLIREEGEYNRIKEILEKSNAAMDAINNCSIKLDVSANTAQEGLEVDLGMQFAGAIDKAKKKMHLNMKMSMIGIDMETDSYYADNTVYTKNPFTEEWEKEILPKAEYDKVFASKNSIDVLDATDVLCAGLKEVKSQNSNEILLRGDVFLGELVDRMSQDESTSNAVFDRFNLELSIDRSTYRANSIAMDVDFHSAEDSSAEKSNMKMKCEYSGYNSSSEIVVPQDVIKNAVERTEFEDDSL